MSQRSQRTKPRLNYKVLHSSGEIKMSEESQNQSQIPDDQTHLEDLSITVETISDDIIDFIDENRIDAQMSSAEIEMAVDKIGQLRSSFRKANKELERRYGVAYQSSYADKFTEVLNSIKDYIKEANRERSSIWSNEEARSQNLKKGEEKAVKFIVTEIGILETEVFKEVSIDLSKLTEDELVRKNNNLGDLRNKLEKLSMKVTELMSFGSEPTELDHIISDYHKIYELMNSYVKNLDKKIQLLELDKEKLFCENMLSIKIGKFNGYDSMTDIYSFQDDFEKIYSRSTPSRLMPDLLKNNHLDEPALSLVRFLDNIDDIWSRLKKAYGDPKMMLSKKLQGLYSLDMNMLWKQKDPEKIVTLSKMVSTMKDLAVIAEKHKIEGKLYNGDALQKIYHMMGDSRMTRWLSTICDEDDIQDKELWMRLIQFLDKELKVQHQKVLHQKPTASPRIETKDGRRSHYVGEKEQKSNGFNNFKTKDDHKQQIQMSNQGRRYNGGRIYEESWNQNEAGNCSFCGEKGHVSTNGPNGIQLVQYFCCKKFTEMTPNQRFLELRSKGFCSQCLFSGASCSLEKHKEGRCQRDFTCADILHTIGLK